jgi:hypothetical protein
VEDGAAEQDGAGDPDPGPVHQLPEPDRVVVHRLRAQVDLEVSDHMNDDEAEENEAGRGHDGLLADRCVEERCGAGHPVSRGAEADCEIAEATFSRRF